MNYFPINYYCLSVISYIIMFTFINPGKGLPPRVLAQEQEPRLSYMKKVMKKILYRKLQTHLTALFKLQILHYNPQESPVRNFRCKIIGENKSAAIKIGTVLHTLFTIRDINDV